MPDTNTPPAAPAIPDPAKHNAEVAQKLLNQDQNPLDIDTAPALEALDKLAAKTTEKNQAEPVEPDPKAGTPPEPDPATPAPTPDEAAEKAAKDAEAKAAKEAELKAATDKYFKDSPGLPPGASPKSSEAFSSIKIKAAQEISAREAELEKLRKEKAALEEKLKNPIPPELEKELEDHRTWRAKLDVDADPKFKEFDKTVSAAQEFVYAQLKKSPAVTDKVIDEIKKLGGPENVNLTKLFEAAKDPTLQKIVESKIADIEMAKYNKEQAIQAAKNNIKQYVDERAKAATAAASQHTNVTYQRLEPLLQGLDWIKEKAVDAKAEEPVRKEIEEYNKFVGETKQQVALALKDDSPEMRAILLTGMAQLFYIQREHGALKKQFEKASAELADITAKYNKVKASSTTRLRESGASTTGTARPKADNDINTRPADALDNLAKKIMETKAAAAAGQ